MELSTVEIVGIVIAAIIIFVLLILFIRWWAQGAQFKDTTVRLDGKVVIITGCNTGIGKETALELARRGGRIYMACRDFKRCEEARKDIVQQTGNQNIFNRTLDLSSLESVRKFAREFLDDEPRLDILINNGGIMAIPRQETKDGIEMQMGTNHMGHFLLTNLLLDRLKASAPSRIVIVSSDGYKYGNIVRDDLNGEKDYNQYRAYCNSKLANVLFTRELSKRLHGTGVVANSLHPGFVATEVQRHQHILNVVLFPMYLFAKTPRSGAQTTIMLALDPKMGKISGNYYTNCELEHELAKARDDDTADWLWKISEQWTGIKPKTQQPV